MDKQLKIRMINSTLAALAAETIGNPSPATLTALAFWQSALNRVTGAK